MNKDFFTTETTEFTEFLDQKLCALRDLCGLIRSIRLLWLASAVAAWSCGGSSSTPTGPTTSDVQISASLSPSPMMTRSQEGTSTPGLRYQIAGEVTFRASSTFSGRITAIDLTILSASGDNGHGSVTLDLAISPGAVATYQLTELVPASTPQEPQRLKVVAKGIDRNGASFEVAPLEIPLLMETRAGGDLDGIVMAAGDIAVCGSTGTEATAKLLDRTPGTILALGDNVYPTGTAEQFANCYGPTWGRHRDRTRPAPGNHEYDVSGAAPYYAYFGAGAGPAGLGYYSFNLGAWHLVSLNSNIAATPGSAQYEWLRSDLLGSHSTCTLAYWHHPLFSSGGNGNNNQMREIWRLLDQTHAEIVLVGHDHDYERFAPQDADGVPTVDGVREFVVGTGGAGLRPVRSVQPNSQVREDQTWGVLRLVLRSSSYNWEFMPVDGGSFRDFGTNACVR